MLRSLWAKLALALLAVLLGVAALYLWLGVFTTETYLDEVRQKLHRELAEHLVAEGLLLEDGDVDPEALEHVIHMLMVVNPSIEVYVLDPGGRVLAYSAPPGKVDRERVSLEPVRRFLARDARLPILGDDPRDPDGHKVFSAAPIGAPEDPEGYVYVVLGGERHDSVVERLSGSYALRMGGAALAAALVFAFAAGLLLFGLITRRLRWLAARMESFQRSGFSEPLPGPEPQGKEPSDEIDLLGATFGRMAARIGEQLGALEHGDRLRRELVANVSHDLRTPLASLHGYLETLELKGDALPEDDRRLYLETALAHSSRLGSRIADLFELARLDAAEVPLHRERFQLPELVQDVMQKFQLEADRKRVRLFSERAQGLPFVDADIGLIERLLENLLGNAIRYTPEQGRVSVSVEGDPRSVRVRVRDTGCGIPADELPWVFERFHRGRSGHADGGTGLGLAIARRIVDLHGGSIEARSRMNEGSEFSFSLPAA